MKPPAGRVGRPPRESAGEVDERILGAARRVFLERGLAGASIDEIASIARAGKPTIYARFSNKKALFAAVMLSNVAKMPQVMSLRRGRTPGRARDASVLARRPGS